MMNVPWFKNSHAYCAYALIVALTLVGVDTALVMQGYPDGLPEPVTTGLFGISTLFLGMAASAQKARSGDE